MSSATNIRRERLIEGVLEGKTAAEAARGAGYSESFARVDVYKTLAKPSIQDRIQARIADARIDADEVLGTLLSHMRGDLADIFPDDEVLQRAQQRGVSHLIKRIKIKERFIPQGIGKEPEREVVTEIEIHDSQAAARHLSHLIGFDRFQRAMDAAEAAPPNRERLAELLRKALSLSKENVSGEAVAAD